ncbi:MAG: NAD(P)/FAD-dependent oxidoreductase [Candidatus Omnitrophota bacterium]|jgi:phytoene dehydrogenase-like protein
MREKYDVVIVGAGIGGLVCGCYLAKAGLKVLIIEQHNKPGGYCTSFERKRYKFDVGVHYLGSMGSGILKKVLQELEIWLDVKRINPTDKIILPKNIVYIKDNYFDTMEGFKRNFPLEARNIENFFNYILKRDFLTIYSEVRKKTFKEVLDAYFKDSRIKAIFSLLLGNIGLSAMNAAAVPAIILFREYILDNGYYPRGGMQSLPDKLVDSFVKGGGVILYSKRVTKISTNSSIFSVELETGEKLFSKTVVSNADANETFKNILSIKTKESLLINRLVFSSSMFLVYLGLKIDVGKILPDKANIWYFDTYNIDRLYSYMTKNVVIGKLQCLFCSFPSMHDLNVYQNNSSTMILSIHAPYKNESFWRNNKLVVGDKMICKASELIPNLKKYIEVTEYATPHTFFKYTSNRKGSFVGWLSIPKQINSSLLPQKTSVKGLYLVGHWTSMGYPGYGGIPNVAFSGRRGAMLILKDLRMKWAFGDIKL